jgi:hypothetical protein
MDPSDPSLRDGAASKLKLNNHPPTSELVTLLTKRSLEDEATARQWFEVLSGRVPGWLLHRYLFEAALSPHTHCVVDFSQAELRKLSEIPFVPVVSTGDKGIVQRLQPIQCYFSGTGGSELHSKLFAFVDFGPRANAFLGACGTRQEPSVEEIAQLLLADPRRIYQLANGREK